MPGLGHVGHADKGGAGYRSGQRQKDPGPKAVYPAADQRACYGAGHEPRSQGPPKIGPAYAQLIRHGLDKQAKVKGAQGHAKGACRRHDPYYDPDHSRDASGGLSLFPLSSSSLAVAVGDNVTHNPLVEQLGFACLSPYRAVLRLEIHARIIGLQPTVHN